MHPRIQCACLLALGACSSGSRSTGAVVSVTATTPADGALDVEPDTPVEVRFATPQAALPAGAITVVDDAGPLRGVATPVGDGSVWRWLKDSQYGGAELPRGARIELRVATAQGPTTSAFRVREPMLANVHDLPSSGTSVRVMVWPDGRRAVAMAGTAYEVSADGLTLTDRMVFLPDEAATFGDGGYLYGADDPALGKVLVRADLAGASESVPMPFPSIPGLRGPFANRHGDAVVFYPGPGPGPGLWRLPNGSYVWQHAAPLSVLSAEVTPGTHPQIDDQGGVYLAHIGGGQARIVHAPAGGAVQEYALPSALPVARFGFAVGGEGRGFASWFEGAELRIARFEPPAGPTVIASVPFDLAGSAWQSVIHAASRSGSTLLDVRGFGSSTGIPPNLLLFRSVLRIERDGWVSMAEPFFGAGYPEPTASPERGEKWYTRADAGTITVRRSRPGAELEPPLPIYEAALPGNSVGYRHLAVDDQGRAVLMVSDSPFLRLVVLQ